MNPPETLSPAVHRPPTDREVSESFDSLVATVRRRIESVAVDFGGTEEFQKVSREIESTMFKLELAVSTIEAKVKPSNGKHQMLKDAYSAMANIEKATRVKSHASQSTQSFN